MAKKKRGRLPGNPTSIRLAEEEKAQIERAGAALGLTGPGFIRAACVYLAGRLDIREFSERQAIHLAMTALRAIPASRQKQFVETLAQAQAEGCTAPALGRNGTGQRLGT